MVYRDRFQGLQSAVRAPHTDDSESFETTLQTTFYIGYRRSDMVYRDRVQGFQSAVRAPHRDDPESLETTIQTTLYIGYRVGYGISGPSSGAPERGSCGPHGRRGCGGAVNAPPVGEPEMLSKPSWRRGGGVRAVPKPDHRADWFRRAWNDVVAPPCMLQGTPLAPNASDSPAKCVPNGGFGTVITHKVDLVSGALTKSTVRHSAHGAHVCTPN
jgi:hypothetical protein